MASTQKTPVSSAPKGPKKGEPIPTPSQPKKPRQGASEQARRGKQSPAKTPALIPQPHGGAIHAGGVPGNAGGGRRPDHVRELATQLGYDELIPKLRAVASDPTSTKPEIISACKAILDLIPRKDEADVASTPQGKQFLEAVYQALSEQCTAVVVASIKARITTLLGGTV